MVGAFGGGILVLFLLAFGAMVGGMVVTFAAHSFLTVVEQTAAGADEVIWPDEPFTDWMWKGIYVVWIAAAWLFPAWLIARWLAPGSLTAFLLVEALLFGLIFPISMLSSLSATSGFVLVRWTVLDRLVRFGGPLVMFYFLSGFLLAGGAVLVGLAFPAWASLQERAVLGGGPGWLAGFLEIWSWIFVLPMTALVAGLVILIYGRLLGRLGWYLSRVAKTREKPIDSLPIAQEAEDVIEAAEVVEEPAEVEPVPAVPSRYETGTYGLAAPEEPAPAAASVSAPPRRLPPPPRRDPDDDPRRPPPPFLQTDLLHFLWSWPGLKALAWLTFGGTLLAFVIRLEIIFWPR